MAKKSPKEVFEKLQNESMEWKLEFLELLKSNLTKQAQTVKEAGEKAAEILERVGS